MGCEASTDARGNEAQDRSKHGSENGSSGQPFSWTDDKRGDQDKNRRRRYDSDDEPEPHYQGLSSVSSTSGNSDSAPQLFRVSQGRDENTEEGTWKWWTDQVRRERLTKDGRCRGHLLDIPTELTRQREEDPDRVELDLSRCYMERSAPFVLGRLFASPHLRELRWVTSLRLDGNYFTDNGFGHMLARMSEANEKRRIMPAVRHLYLSNMNLDKNSVAGIFSFLFPIDIEQITKGATEDQRIGGSRVPRPSEDFAPIGRSPQVPLFPELSLLSLSENVGLGTTGLVTLLRSLLAPHINEHELSTLDLSRCGIDSNCHKYLREFCEKLPTALKADRNPIVPRTVVLHGNHHQIEDVYQDLRPPRRPEIKFVV